MISKLVKAQENWLFKSIFIAVAISFISLFGVTGYINTAAQNQDVVNVGGSMTGGAANSKKNMMLLKLELEEEIKESDKIVSKIKLIEEEINEIDFKIAEETDKLYLINKDKIIN